MTTCTHRWAWLCLLVTLLPAAAHTQVFVVGEKTATADIATDFTPTTLPLPDGRLDERGRRDLVRNLEAEQGFAHRALPLGPGVILYANGKLLPGPVEYRRMIYEKGESVAPGDRVIITSITIKPDRLIFDLNGGPYAKHRFLSHVQINDVNLAPTAAPATGSRITLVFEGQVPDISAPEIKSLLQPLVDFGVKTSEQAYADTLPAPIKESIAEHTVLVGMNRRMVLAALGAPERKDREQPNGDPSAPTYEEWIYGHVPQTVRFVRFNGDRVVRVEIAALGKPLEIHDKDEMGGFTIRRPIREIALGDRPPDDNTQHAAAPPTLRNPGEAVPTGGMDRVQYPVAKSDKPANPDHPDSSTPAPPAATPVQVGGATTQPNSPLL